MKEQLIKIRNLLDKHGLTGVVLTEETNVAWLFGGRYHVNVVSLSACAVIYVTHQRVEALVNNIEAQRLQDEEGLEVDCLHIYPWDQDASRATQLQTWMWTPNCKVDTELSSEFKQLRVVLEDDRLHDARVLGRNLAEALDETCFGMRPGQTELGVAGKLSEACMKYGIEPIVSLVGNERRAHDYRHLLPTQDTIAQYAIVSVGGRWKGLVLSATRLVHFGAPSRALANKYAAVLRVEAAFLAASRPGKTLREAFQCGLAQYGEEEFTHEWQHHHQGGIAGYESREVRASQAANHRLTANLLVAWNPSIQGVKAEDTAVINADGVEILTHSSHTPLESVSVNGFEVSLPTIFVVA